MSISPSSTSIALQNSKDTNYFSSGRNNLLLQILCYQTYKRTNKSNFIFMLVRLLYHLFHHKSIKKKNNSKDSRANNDHINYPLNSNHNLVIGYSFLEFSVLFFSRSSILSRWSSAAEDLSSHLSSRSCANVIGETSLDSSSVVDFSFFIWLYKSALRLEPSSLFSWSPSTVVSGQN